MAIVDLVLLAIWLLLVAGVRGAIAARRPGRTVTRARDRRGSPQWWSRTISSAGFLFAIAAPLAELGGLAPFAPLDTTIVHALGIVLVIAGTALTLVSQQVMGESWRADVDPEARTPLVASGPFRIVRNPILTATATTVVGLALLVPNVLSLLMLVAVITGMQIQVRLVEEPYLQSVHGDAYRRYAARTGRFLPGIGRLQPSSRDM